MEGTRPQRYILDEQGRALILKHYDGSSECITRLAERLHVPRWRVQKWASALGVARPPCKLTDEGRKMMVERYDGSSERINEIASRFGVERRAVMRWAKRLGLTNKKPPPWTDADEAYLMQHFHHMSVTDIALRLKRSKTAVLLKAKRLGTNKCFQEGYTINSLAEALGCSQTPIRKWIEKGWLKGKRRETEREQADVWLFTDRDIREFIRKHPNEIDPKKCDWLWLVDVLVGGDCGLGSLALSQD